MTSFSLIECHILCYSGIGTIEEATKYFFSGQPSFNWILVRAVRTKSLQSCLILCDPVDCQAPLSKGFSRQDSWSGLPFPPPGDLPDPGRQSSSLMSPALAGGFFMTSTTWEAPQSTSYINNVCLLGNFIFICMVCILNEHCYKYRITIVGDKLI